MDIRRHTKPQRVIGPFGEALSLADLPANNTARWVIRRKAEVVAAVNGGLLSLEDACARYDLSLEEFCSWQETIESSGLPGLRVSQLSRYRADQRANEGNTEPIGSHPLKKPTAGHH